MSAVRQALLDEALARGGTPCAGKASLEECFTVGDGVVRLWFNTPDHSTHIVQGEEG